MRTSIDTLGVSLASVSSNYAVTRMRAKAVVARDGNVVEGNLEYRHRYLQPSLDFRGSKTVRERTFATLCSRRAPTEGTQAHIRKHLICMRLRSSSGIVRQSSPLDRSKLCRETWEERTFPTG